MKQAEFSKAPDRRQERNEARSPQKVDDSIFFLTICFFKVKIFCMRLLNWRNMSFASIEGERKHVLLMRNGAIQMIRLPKVEAEAIHADLATRHHLPCKRMKSFRSTGQLWKPRIPVHQMFVAKGSPAEGVSGLQRAHCQQIHLLVP